MKKNILRHLNYFKYNYKQTKKDKQCVKQKDPLYIHISKYSSNVYKPIFILFFFFNLIFKRQIYKYTRNRSYMIFYIIKKQTKLYEI